MSAASFEQRLSDSVRNMKNYCIIMNTLLRKAAENGGVHPVYLDSVSSGFAKKIESINAVSEMPTLMNEMIRSYCRLVSKHSIRKYSLPVQKAITYIDSDLTMDLSLSSLAAMQNVSAGYLSALFKQETGQTITEHVNQKRIKYAMRLLKTTKLQVQTIAQHCGIVDVHYFSKLFKKYVGKTPKEYREST
jgi:YesN/AraC family two-component response regulator